MTESKLRAENEQLRAEAQRLLDRWHLEDEDGVAVEEWAREVVDWLNRVVHRATV